MTFRYQPVPIVDYWVGAALMLGAPGGSDGKESAFSVGDLGSISVLGRSPGKGNGNPLQYSRLETTILVISQLSATKGVP